ncbi:MAG TPA: DUF3800 domain-containing protein [Thermoanaerobaculia bacterium]
MITAFLDESGIDAGSKYVWIGGYVGRSITWNEFERQWKQHLGEYGVSSLHMRRLYSGKGDYSGWDRARIDSFLTDSARLINSFDFFGVAAGVEKAAYARFAEKVPTSSDLRSRFGKRALDPYFLALQYVISELVIRADEESLGEAVSFYLEEQREYEHFARQLHADIQQSAWVRARWVGSLSFAPKASFGAFQAADFLIWEIRRELDERAKPDRRKERASLTRLRRLPIATPYLDESVLGRILRDVYAIDL